MIFCTSEILVTSKSAFQPCKAEVCRSDCFVLVKYFQVAPLLHDYLPIYKGVIGLVPNLRLVL